MKTQTIILIIATIAIVGGLIVYTSLQMKKEPTVYEPFPTEPDTATPVTNTPSNNAPSQQSPQIIGTPSPSGEIDGEIVACTMEAKMCPDGSYVGRTGPRCEFAACPASK